MSHVLLWSGARVIAPNCDRDSTPLISLRVSSRLMTLWWSVNMDCWRWRWHETATFALLIFSGGDDAGADDSLLPLPSFGEACLSSCGSFSLVLLFDTATANPQFPTIAPAAQQPALHPSNGNYCCWWWWCHCMACYCCRGLVLGMHMISGLL